METTICIMIPAMMKELMMRAKEDSIVETENVRAHYPDAESFEEALNSLAVDIGDTVTFKIEAVNSFSEDRYNLHAGKHLYFVMPKDREYEVGEEVTVEVQYVYPLPDDMQFTSITWFINDDRQEIKRYVDECVQKLLDEDSPEEN